MDSFSNLGHECSLCHGPAGAFDSVDLVTIKSDFVRRLETINGLTVYICKDCMDRYKENKLVAEKPKALFLIFTIAGVVIGGLWLVINLIKHHTGNALFFSIMLLVGFPVASFLNWRISEAKYGKNSKPMDPYTLPVDCDEFRVAVYNLAGKVQYTYLKDWQAHEKNPNGTSLQKVESSSIENYPYHYLAEVVKKAQANQDQGDSIQVNVIEEISEFKQKLLEKFGKGKEFAVREVVSFVSPEYVNWFAQMAQQNKIYSINWRESAVVDLLGSLQRDGIVGNKRVEVRNSYGDEDWFYTLL